MFLSSPQVLLAQTVFKSVYQLKTIRHNTILMKLSLTILIALFTISNVFAAPSIKAKKTSGNWANSSDWDLSRVPTNNDSIIIPFGMTMVIDNNISLNQVVIRVYGVLKFTNGKLNLDAASKLILETGSLVDGNGSNDQIRYINTNVYNGSMGDLTGPMVLSSIGGFQPVSLLPVTFVSFAAKKASSKILLTWVTDHEVNNNHFVVERSIDGSTWKAAGIVMASMNSGLNKYEFRDDMQKGSVINYRIRQVDIDGSSMFSKIQSIRATESASSAQIFASAKNTITVQFVAPLKSIAQIRVFAANGQVLKQVAAAALTSKLNIPVSNGAGAYVVQLMNENGAVESKQIIL